MKSRNKVYLSVLLSVAAMLFQGCRKDLLDKNPLAQISSGSFWKTEADAKMGLAGVYARLTAGYNGYYRIFLDGLTDNAYAQYAWDGNIQPITLGDVSPVTGGVLNSIYYDAYKGISSCNYFLENIDKVAISDQRKNSYKGEVRFLRAYFYFELVTHYGGVPLYKESPASADAAKVKQQPAADVLSFIREDLNFSIANLPDTKYEGSAVRGSAQGLLLRVLLFEQKWGEAATLGQQVINGGKFSLAPSYKGLFLNSSQEGNPEIMFSTRYLGPNEPQADGGGTDIEQGWWSALAPLDDLINDYECTDGKAILESPLYNPASPYLNRDPRLDMTVKCPGEKWIYGNGSEWVPDPSPTGFSMEKYVDLSHLPFGYDMSQKTDQDYVHIRFADVLLMYAEAKNEVSGPDATVYKALNLVRARADVKMPPVDEAKYNTQSKLREYIRHERRIEFAMEGLRDFDLKRWKIAHIKLPAIKTPGGTPLKFEQKNYLWPFPQSERDNNPQLDQNTGY